MVSHHIGYEEDISENPGLAEFLDASAAIEEEIADYLASDDVRAKRQAHVAQLILDEEALEGVFEGLRFYDIMRYQMQENGGASLGTTITMPAYIEEKYGTTTKMAGKPWFLTLPNK